MVEESKPRLPQPFFDWLRSDDGTMLREDVLGGWPVYYPDQQRRSSDGSVDLDATANHLFFLFSEFRTLVDYRVNHSRDGAQFSWLFPEHRRASDLNVWCDDIGPRCVFQHASSTYLSARSIGSDFMCNQNVTVGYNRSGPPAIGHHVIIRPGAVVVGDITVGNHVHVTANAVVHFDVPSNSSVYAPRSVVRPA